MRIDSHQHFWRYDAGAYPWIDERMPVLKRDYLPEDLLPLLRDAGFDGSIAVQARTDVAETAWLLDLADRHSFICGVVGWVDLLGPDVVATIERLARKEKLCGIRHIVQSEPDDRFLLRPDFQAGIAALERFGLVYDILIYPRQLPAAAELVRRFPEQLFVLDHIAKPAIAEKRMEPWATDLRALARSPNVTCKLSGLVTEADWKTWKPADIAPYLDLVCEAFGPERLMIGSDWPVCLLAGEYPSVLSVVIEHIARFTPADREAILGGTAEKVYVRSRHAR